MRWAILGLQVDSGPSDFILFFSKGRDNLIDSSLLHLSPTVLNSFPQQYNAEKLAFNLCPLFFNFKLEVSQDRLFLTEQVTPDCME